MNLEFKIYEIKENTRSYQNLIEKLKLENEFIIVGEELIGKLDTYKAVPVDENGIKFIADLKIDEFCMNIPKDELKLQSDGIGYNTYEFNIPKKYLTMNAIENIQRLNE